MRNLTSDVYSAEAYLFSQSYLICYAPNSLVRELAAIMIHFNMWKLLQGVSTVIVLVLLAIMAFSYSPHTQDTVMSLMQELKQSR